MYYQEVGTILALFTSEKGISLRKSVPLLYADKKGIKNDKFYDTDIERSVLITSKESYSVAKKNNIIIPYGSLGENLLIDYNPYHLKEGDCLKLGEVILRITQNCTICNHLSSVNPELPSLLKEDRGIFAKVVQTGKISLNDKIYILS